MPMAKLAGRVSDQLGAIYNNLLGRDPLSHIPLARRGDLRRIGSRYGGWLIPADLINAGSICYCVGCGEDISFDLGLIELFRCDVYAFDPTPRAVQYVNTEAAGNEHYHFSDLGLWDSSARLKFYLPNDPTHVSHSLVNAQETSDYIEVPVDRLSNIMRANQHKSLDLLKLDIEGAEYNVLDSIFADQLSVKIICVEFDRYRNPVNEVFSQRILSYVRQIVARGYLIIDAPGNGNYTFLRNDVVTAATATPAATTIFNSSGDRRGES